MDSYTESALASKNAADAWEEYGKLANDKSATAEERRAAVREALRLDEIAADKFRKRGKEKGR